jgi:hypothetical protein
MDSQVLEKPMNVDTIRVTEVLVLDKADIRYTQDGYLVANPRVGRIGIQIYSGKELGKPDMDRVRVWRPESEVMDKAAMATIAHRPITNNHPPEPVTSDNWKKYGAGHTGDTVARDGEFVRVPIMLSDGILIKQYQDGKKELSLGYTSRLEWRSGKTDQGELYDAVQTMIRVNHLAVVDAARGGSKLAIGDSITIDQAAVDQAKALIGAGKIERTEALDVGQAPAGKVLLLVSTAGAEKYPFAKDGVVYRSALVSIKAQTAADQEPHVGELCDQLVQLIDATEMENPAMAGENTNQGAQTTIVVDGVTLQMADIAASVVLRRMKALEAETSDLRSKLELQAEASKKKTSEDAATIATHVASIGTKDAEIVTLKKQVEDSKLTPAKLDELVKDRALVAGKARVVLGDKLVVDGKTVGEIRRQVVDTKLGDAAKGWNEDQVMASFTALTADIKDEQVQQTITASDALRRTFSGPPAGGAQQQSDKVYDAYDKRLGEAWKGDQAAKH